MKHLPSQFPSILVIYCFCMLQIPSSGASQPLADSPDGLDIVEFEENQVVYKRFLFQYSRTQKPKHPTNSEFVPVHPLMRLAAKLSSRRMKKLPHPDFGTATVDFPKKACEPRENTDFQKVLEKRAEMWLEPGSTSTWGRPFFLFRSRNGRDIDSKFQ